MMCVWERVSMKKTLLQSSSASKSHSISVSPFKGDLCNSTMLECFKIPHLNEPSIGCFLLRKFKVREPFWKLKSSHFFALHASPLVSVWVNLLFSFAILSVTLCFYSSVYLIWIMNFIKHIFNKKHHFLKIISRLWLYLH